MNINCALENKHFSDINPLSCGAQECESGQMFGPYVRQYYLIHYIFSGKGTFVSKGETYHLSAGQFFLIYPDEVTTYMADETEPWTYLWIGFTGSLAKRFDKLDKPVGELPNVVFYDVLRMIQDNFPSWSNMREEYLTTIIYRIMSILFSETNTFSDNYAKRVKTFIQSSYMDDISVQTIADTMSLDRRYLSRLFKQRYRVSIQEYLISVRIENAAKFLLDGYTVNESCDMCGYKDRSNFSRMFYRRYNVWPSKYSVKNSEKLRN